MVRKSNRKKPPTLVEMLERFSGPAAKAKAAHAEKVREVRRASQRRLTEHNAARHAAQRAEKAKANRAARLEADPSRLDRRRLDKPGWQVLLDRMAPGEWYGQPDLVALVPEFARGSVKAWIAQKLPAAGLIERAPNADFDAAAPDRRQLQPRMLYRKADSRGS